MPNLLKQLELEELSLVDRPANAQAMVSLYKRDNNPEEINKMDEEMEALIKAYMEKNSVTKEDAIIALSKFSEVQEEVETLKSENEMLRKGLIDNGYTIKADSIEKKDVPVMIEVGGEQINKADLPEAVIKALESAEIEKADVALTKRAKEVLPHFDSVVAKSLLSVVDKMDDAEIVLQALQAADKAFEDTMREFGKNEVESDFNNSTEELDSLVTKYMDDNKLTKSQRAIAYAAVAKTDAGKALINKSYKEKE